MHFFRTMPGFQVAPAFQKPINLSQKMQTENYPTKFRRLNFGRFRVKHFLEFQKSIKAKSVTKLFSRIKVLNLGRNFGLRRPSRSEPDSAKKCSVPPPPPRLPPFFPPNKISQFGRCRVLRGVPPLARNRFIQPKSATNVSPKLKISGFRTISGEGAPARSEIDSIKKSDRGSLSLVARVIRVLIANCHVLLLYVCAFRLTKRHGRAGGAPRLGSAQRRTTVRDRCRRSMRREIKRAAQKI